MFTWINLLFQLSIRMASRYNIYQFTVSTKTNFYCNMNCYIVSLSRLPGDNESLNKYIIEGGVEKLI